MPHSTLLTRPSQGVRGVTTARRLPPAADPGSGLKAEPDRLSVMPRRRLPQPIRGVRMNPGDGRNHRHSRDGSSDREMATAERRGWPGSGRHANVLLLPIWLTQTRWVAAAQPAALCINPAVELVEAEPMSGSNRFEPPRGAQTHFASWRCRRAATLSPELGSDLVPGILTRNKSNHRLSAVDSQRTRPARSSRTQAR